MTGCLYTISKCFAEKGSQRSSIIESEKYKKCSGHRATVIKSRVGKHPARTKPNSSKSNLPTNSTAEKATSISTDRYFVHFSIFQGGWSAEKQQEGRQGQAGSSWACPAHSRGRERALLTPLSQNPPQETTGVLF